MSQFTNPSRSFSARPQHEYNDPIAVTDTSTVVANYEADATSATAHQSEAELEQALIEQLQRQAYEYLDIRTPEAMRANLRAKLEQLNDYQFSDAEWDNFYRAEIANPAAGIVEKTRTIQIDHEKVLTRDDGTSKNIRLIDKQNIHRNQLQVINQYATKGSEHGNHSNRYDVTILVNGLPLVHIELKSRGVALSTKSTAISATPSGRTGDFSNTSSCLSSPTAPIPSTTQTPPATCTSKRPPAAPTRAKTSARRPTRSSSRPGGLTPPTNPSPT